MAEERDVIILSDDDGCEFEVEIEDYFMYDGQEYVILCSTAQAEGEEVDAYVMKVVPIDEENEEFLPIDPEIEDDVLAYANEYLTSEDDEE